MKLIGAALAALPLLGFVLGLATYERVVLVLAGSGSLMGGACIVWLILVTRAVKKIQAAQSDRIDSLPPPPED